MVDLTDAGSPFQQSIPDFAFYVPAVVVFTLAGEFRPNPHPPLCICYQHLKPPSPLNVNACYMYNLAEIPANWVKRLSPSEQLS